MEDTDIYWMKEALKEASHALMEDEVPVGAVIVLGDRCLARTHDRRESTGDPTAHAEILAIRQAAREIGDWRLSGCNLYVTLEPCPMCAGAMILARVKRLIYGAVNLKAGAVESHARILSVPTFNHLVMVTPGILPEECAAPLSQFFQNKRRKNSG
jgi:tRNA(adenine34) deaminase